MSISTSLYPAFSDDLIEQNYCFKAALETLKIHKNKILKLESYFLDPSSHNLHDLFMSATKDLFFFEVEEKWHKTCQGHEYKIEGKVHKKHRAQEKAANSENKYKDNPNIIPDSVWSEVRGHYDPFVHFKYIDNCADCNCKTLNTRDVKKINVSEVLAKAEQDALAAEIPIETFYSSILDYIQNIPVI